MICTNDRCKKEFSKPLELFNGVLTCPFCKKEINLIQDLKLTKENEELFELSEIYYFRYLSPQSIDAKNSANRLDLKPTELLDMAIKYCKESANLGNPKAVYRMGFYNEYYMQSSRAKKDRICLAFDYYESLCYHSKDNVETTAGAVSMTNSEFKALKRASAKRILELLANNEKEFEGIRKYDKKSNIARIEKLYGNLGAQIVTNESKLSKVNSIYQTLFNCFAKGSARKPLFGLYFVTGQELKELFEGNSASRNFVGKGLDLWIFESDTLCNFKPNTYPVRLKNRAKIDSVLSMIKDDGCYYVYFFNSVAKLTLLSKLNRKNVKASLEKNDFELVKEFPDTVNNVLEYLFYEDDIYYFKKGFGVKGCVNSLLNYINEGR